MSHSRSVAAWPFALLACLLASEARGESAQTISVVYSPSLKETIESVTPAFERASGAKVSGRAVPIENISLGHDSGADVVVVTEPEIYLTQGSPDQVEGYVMFASDAMVVAYRRDGRYAAAKDKGTPWIEALRAPGMVFARPPPERLLGQRAIFVLDLAEEYYGAKDLVKNVLRPDQLMESEAIVEGLGKGPVDVALLYRSLAVENKLPLQDLPVEINLSDPDRTGVYAEASTEVGGSVATGEPILIGAAALGSAKQPELAKSFVDFLASPEAKPLLEAGGHVVPPGFPAWRYRLKVRSGPPLK